MMFATLDDLEGAVEILVFGKALAEHEAALAIDQVVLVRGRVDHKEAGKTCVVVQSAEAFAPSEEEIHAAKVKAGKDAARGEAQTRQPLRLRVDPARLQATAIEDLKHLIESFPGPTEVVLEMHTTAGPRRLRLGEAYRVAPSPALLAEFEQVLAAA